MEKKVLFAVEGKIDGAVCDEGIVYECNGRYYLHWIGLGKTRRISEGKVTEYERELLRRVNDEKKI